MLINNDKKNSKSDKLKSKHLGKILLHLSVIYYHYF
jgi:hypothetical protein